MTRLWARLLLLLFIAVPSWAESGFTIEITSGYDRAIPLAIVPFDTGELLKFEDIAGIVEANLQRTGQFELLAREKMGSRPSAASQVLFREWRLLAQDYILVGKVETDGDRMIVTATVMDTFQEVNLGTKSYTAANSQANAVAIAHRISDFVYEAITGSKGAFATKIAYVVESLKGDTYHYELMIADADGNRARVLHSSDMPIISPAWHPEGKKLAFAFYTQTGDLGIMEVDTRSGQKEVLVEPLAQSSAPAYSPDGSMLAYSVTVKGNSDIYLLDLQTRRRQMLTRHWAIDTEPEWALDGKSIFFTSDRSGRPQIYRLALDSDRAERISFEGKYNARARVLPEGDAIIVIHQSEESGAGYQMMRIDLNNGSLWPLTEPGLDESPSVAPNGAMVVYAEKVGSNARLAWVSVDGEVKSSMPVLSGSVKEPSWSPYLH
jgi:TolB protein